MILEGKKILIFSPQPWNHISVSKHHYALELSKKNDVFFFSAPVGFGFSTKSKNINNRLKVFEYHIPFLKLLRFKLEGFYIRTTVLVLGKIIKRKIGLIDLCIDFGCDRFIRDLDFLNAKKKIYFRVDDSPNFKPSYRGANILLSVSMNIVEKFALHQIQCHYINHGLAEAFIRLSEGTENIIAKNSIDAGYSGNILIPHLDREMIIRTIVENRNVTFHFFGVVRDEKMTDNQRQWILALKSQPNVVLHGVLDTEKLVSKFQQIDIFLLCYNSEGNTYHSDNSHKILEYLSTGKVIVSSWIRHYSNLDLFPMCQENVNRDFPNLFRQILMNLNHYNNKEFTEKRIKYAKENSYKNHIQKISTLLID